MGKIEKLLVATMITFVLVLALVLVTEAQDTSLCDSNPALYISFGTYCLNPVMFNIPEMPHPIGTILLVQANGGTDFGIVSGYSWQRIEQRYAYWVITKPADWNMNPPFAGEYQIIFPENVYGAR